jgi:aminobenzoyl-glutamate utilization protein B
MATPISHKGATAGAKAHALTVLDLMLRPELLQQAKDYFAEQTKDIKWQSLIPPGTEPPVHFNKEKMERVRGDLKRLRYDPSRYKTYLEQLGIAYPTVKQ